MITVHGSLLGNDFVTLVAVFISAAVHNHHRHSLRGQQRLHRQCMYDASCGHSMGLIFLVVKHDRICHN